MTEKKANRKPNGQFGTGNNASPGRPKGTVKKKENITILDEMVSSYLPDVKYLPNGKKQKRGFKITTKDWATLAYMRIMGNAELTLIDGRKLDIKDANSKQWLDFMKIVLSSDIKTTMHDDSHSLKLAAMGGASTESLDKLAKVRAGYFKSKTLNSVIDFYTKFYLRGWQREAVDCDADYMLMHGGRASGKSTVATARTCLLPLMYDNMVSVVIRKAKVYNRFSTFASNLAFLRGSDLWEFVESVNVTSMAIKFINGSTIYHLGVLNEAQRESLKGIGSNESLGGEIDFVYIEEADSIGYDDDFYVIDSSVRGTAMGKNKNQVMILNNPRSKEVWINEYIVPDKETKHSKINNLPTDRQKTVKVYHKTVEDNEHIKEYNPSYIDKLKALKGYKYDRYYLGLYTSADGGVYLNYKPSEHVIKIPKKDVELALTNYDLFFASDVGATDATCGLWAFVKEVERTNPITLETEIKPHVFIYREFYMWGVIKGRLADYYLSFEDTKNVRTAVLGHDSTSESEELGRGDVNSVVNVTLATRENVKGLPRKKWDKARMAELADEMFSDGRLTYIDGSLIKLSEVPVELKRATHDGLKDGHGNSVLDELPNIRYSSKGDGKLEDGNDHGSDALCNLMLAVDKYYNKKSNHLAIDSYKDIHGISDEDIKRAKIAMGY